MELAQVSVSYEKLAAAARALGVDIAQLFTPAPNPIQTRSAQVQPTVVSTTIADAPGYSTGNYDYHPMTGDFPGRSMTPMYARIFARELQQFEDYIRHPGQEFGPGAVGACADSVRDRGSGEHWPAGNGLLPVSYTHLTLPTKA